jgi:monoterpene epsilon-lactone hydrolase
MAVPPEAGKAGVEVTRVIPVPTSISAEAQGFLSMGFAMRPEDAVGDPEPDDIEGWRAMIAAANEGIKFGFDMLTADVTFTIDAVTLAGAPVFDITPEGADTGAGAPIYFDMHGGALIMGGGDACLAMAKNTAAMVQMHTYSVDYRMPPVHPYPAALDDCVAVYKALLETHAPEQIVIGGQSAGGNLAAALMLRARAEGLPLPAAVVLLSPEADLTESGDTFETLMGVDPVLTARLDGSIGLYAAGRDLTDPYLSPLFGEYSLPFPPVMLQAGTRDLLLSNTVRLHRKLRDAGIDAELHVWEAMPHGGFFGAPEDRELGAEVRRFIGKQVS